ncbi:aldehyde dehydrogenase [Luteimonas sp. RIT-PG2_3]
MLDPRHRDPQVAVQAPLSIYVDGDWRKPDSAVQLPVISPVTEEVFARYAEGNAHDIDDAVAAARRAFDDGPWPHMPADERGAYLERIADLLDARLPELANAWTVQVGAPIAMTRYAVAQAPQLFRFHARLLRDTPMVDVRTGAKGGRVRVLREPVGVVAAITPWNAPLVLLCYKVAAALAAGCTVVAKPSPETPIDAYLLAECIHAAGVPAGVFNVVAGGRELGEHLIRHPGIDKISFTGSTAAGRHIAAVAAQRMLRTGFELGGKSAAIVLEDADIGHMLQSLVPYSMPIAGQVCFSLTRLLVPESRKREVTDAYVGAMAALKLGDPFADTTQMGPLAMARQLQRVQDYIASGHAQGATLLLGGGRPTSLSRGYYIEPTVFGDVDNAMTIAQEEIFGPVVSIISYTDLDDAVRKANDTIFGLHGAVYTPDAERGYAVARRLRSGSVTVNGLIVDPTMPFGGFKQSGIGREGGIEGFDAYLETKTVYFA